ncbi:hypothetical protein EVAR_15781_1 [Eumeta japonica]|uniref:Uncharacterized protein n=1 Tax=Eumeta variegata TaxID=151549 RepID=A0A4C1TZD0_EUMVA|nr:hypothetical protein EVAR_15781_1 [Eumeta japonica]
MGDRGEGGPSKLSLTERNATGEDVTSRPYYVRVWVSSEWLNRSRCDFHKEVEELTGLHIEHGDRTKAARITELKTRTHPDTRHGKENQSAHRKEATRTKRSFLQKLTHNKNKRKLFRITTANFRRAPAQREQRRKARQNFLRLDKKKFKDLAATASGENLSDDIFAVVFSLSSRTSQFTATSTFSAAAPVPLLYTNRDLIRTGSPFRRSSAGLNNFIFTPASPHCQLSG